MFENLRQESKLLLFEPGVTPTAAYPRDPICSFIIFPFLRYIYALQVDAKGSMFDPRRMLRIVGIKGNFSLETEGR
jgi:hypothetical protein